MNNTNSLTLESWDKNIITTNYKFIAQELILSAISILIIVLIVKLLIRVIRKHDAKRGVTDSKPIRKICKWFFILMAIGYIYYLWFGNIHYYLNDHVEVATTLGVPIGIITALGIADWKATLWNIVKCSIICGFVAFFAAIFIPKGYYDLVVKIAATIIWAFSAIQMFKSDGSYIA